MGFPYGIQIPGRRSRGKHFRPAGPVCSELLSLPNTQNHLSPVEPLCSATRRGRAGEGAQALRLPTSGRHRPRLGRSVSERQLRIPHSPPSEAALAVAGRSQLPGSPLLVTSGKGALLRPAGLLHLAWALLVHPPLWGTGWEGEGEGRGGEGPGPGGAQPRAFVSSAEKTVLPGGPGAAAPRAREVSLPRSGSALLLNPEQQSLETTPAPWAQRRSAPAPKPPASCSLQRRAREAEAPGSRVRSPRPAAGRMLFAGSGESLQGGVPTKQGFPPKPFPSLSIPAASLRSAHSGGKECSPPDPNSQPPLPAVSR